MNDLFYQRSTVQYSTITLMGKSYTMALCGAWAQLKKERDC